MVYPPLGLHVPVIDLNNNREDIPFFLHFKELLRLKPSKIFYTILMPIFACWRDLKLNMK